MKGERKQISMAGLPFNELRDRNKYFVDKSLLIKDLLSTDDSGVFLFTRPRRFGKTTNLSMLDAFFNIEYKGNTWFDDLEISKYPEYNRHKNAYPVIYVNLRFIKEETYDAFICGVRKAMSLAVKPHMHIIESDRIDDVTRRMLANMRDTYLNEMDLKDSLRFLSEALYDYYGVHAVILIDEYDCSLSDSFGKESHRPMLSFLRGFLGLALKDNPNLQMAYVTGVMQIAKESIFSDLNNIQVYNVFSSMSDERFGFTETEIKELLAYYDLSDQIDVIRKWYDGYKFGKAEVYNPYSVLCFIRGDCIPKPYWANTGSNAIIQALLDCINQKNLAVITNLLTYGSADVRINEALAYGNVYDSDESLFSLMAMAGYLNTKPIGNGLCCVSIPNMEIRTVIDGIMREEIAVRDSDLTKFNNALINSDAEGMRDSLESILSDESYLVLHEYTYEAIIVTVLHLLSEVYEVRADHESGNDRTDIRLRPKNAKYPWVVFELKTVGSRKQLDRDLDEAFNQIHENKYYMDMRGRVVLIGIALCRKIPKVRIETIDV